MAKVLIRIALDEDAPPQQRITASGSVMHYAGVQVAAQNRSQLEGETIGALRIQFVSADGHVSEPHIEGRRVIDAIPFDDPSQQDK